MQQHAAKLKKRSKQCRQYSFRVFRRGLSSILWLFASYWIDSNSIKQQNPTSIKPMPNQPTSIPYQSIPHRNQINTNKKQIPLNAIMIAMPNSINIDAKSSMSMPSQAIPVHVSKIGSKSIKPVVNQPTRRYNNETNSKSNKSNLTRR